MNELAAIMQSTVEAATMGPDFWRSGIKAIADGSAAMISWALALAGGSIVTIVSTSYLRPPRRMRLAYFLFLPGWLFLGLSVHHGDVISRHYLAAQVGKPELLRTIAVAMNPEYASQQKFLGWALVIFAVWLVVFLIWWILDESPSSTRDS